MKSSLKFLCIIFSSSLLCLTQVSLAETRTAPQKATPVASNESPGASNGSSNYSTTQASIELGGASLLYSLFGSYRVKEDIAVNLGLSYISLSATATAGSTTTSASASLFQLPLSVSYLWGGQNSFLELLGGLDLAFLSITAGSTYSGLSGGLDTGGVSGTIAIPEIGVGYRYWPWDGGFHFRFTVYLLIAKKTLPWAGLSLGVAF